MMEAIIVGRLARQQAQINSLWPLFTADGGSFSFDTVVVVVDSSTYPHSIITETPAITVADGQTQTYRVQILLDAIG